MKRRRGVHVRSDEQVLAHGDDLELLRAVAAGRVSRGADGSSTAMTAPHYLDGEPVRMSLLRLAREELLEVPISGAPRLAPRGARLLRRADGEAPAPRAD